MKIQNIQINAAPTKHKQHRSKVTKPQTNTLSKYCEENTKKKKKVSHANRETDRRYLIIMRSRFQISLKEKVIQ
jgi:hypothetical protein